MLVRRFRFSGEWGLASIDSIALRGGRQRGERIELLSNATCTGIHTVMPSQIAVVNDYLCVDRQCQVAQQTTCLLNHTAGSMCHSLL